MHETLGGDVLRGSKSTLVLEVSFTLTEALGLGSTPSVSQPSKHQARLISDPGHLDPRAKIIPRARAATYLIFDTPHPGCRDKR